MKIALIDDEQAELDRLYEYITCHLGADTGCDCFHSGEEFLRCWSSGDYDLVVMDIFMGGMTGVELAKRVRGEDHEVHLVFCTTSNEFASESYEVNASYYLHKPFSEEKVAEMLGRLNIEEMERCRTLLLPDGQSVMPRNIVYMDYAGHDVTIHNKKGSDISSRLSQTELETSFSKYPYIKCCSKGVFVNFFEVESLCENVFFMKNGQSLPVSRRKAKEVAQEYSTFLFEKMRKDGEV